MRVRPVVVAALPVAALLVAAAAGCGVTPDDRPRTITPPRGPFQALASPHPTAVNGAIPQTLFLVKEDKLVAVTRRFEAPPTPRDLLAALAAGPTDAERGRGLTSALLGGTAVTGVRATAGQARVDLAAAVEGAPRTDEVLAYAQLVCTLTARPDITGVTFFRDGTPVGVPRADGSLSTGPLIAADYAPLVG
jgi:hypothetical protein